MERVKSIFLRGGGGGEELILVPCFCWRGGGGETGIFLSRTVVAIVSHTDTNFCKKDRKTKSE